MKLLRDAMNELVEWMLTHCRALAGQNCRVTYFPDGQRVEAVLGAAWRHPWFTSPEWLPQTQTQPGYWAARVKAGFVNGKAPVISTTVGRAPTATLARERATKWQGVNLGSNQASIDSPLFDQPSIALAFRSIGSDGVDSEAVPKFFKELGVGDPPKDISSILASGGLIPADLNPVTPGNRLLRACDLVLIQPRVALTAQTVVSNPLVDSVSFTQTLDLREPYPSERLAVAARAKYESASDGGIQPWSPTYEEPTWDEKLISTVYLLSPPNAALGSAPEATWTPYVAHHLFWNLNWAQPLAPDVPMPQPLTLIVPLAGGVAQPIINSILSSVNDVTQAFYNQIGAHSMEGRFWTV